MREGGGGCVGVGIVEYVVELLLLLVVSINYDDNKVNKSMNQSTNHMGAFKELNLYLTKVEL